MRWPLAAKIPFSTLLLYDETVNYGATLFKCTTLTNSCTCTKIVVVTFFFSKLFSCCSPLQRSGEALLAILQISHAKCNSWEENCRIHLSRCNCYIVLIIVKTLRHSDTVYMCIVTSNLLVLENPTRKLAGRNSISMMVGECVGLVFWHHQLGFLL